MSQHRTNTSGQLVELSERLNEHQQARRQAKIVARRTTADALRADTFTLAAVVAGIIAIIRRGFFGRMKWLLFGTNRYERTE